MLNKKSGQIGKTITWVVATIIVIVILLVAILVSTSYLGESKKADFLEQTDMLASKSFFAYLLTKDEGKTVYEQLKNQYADLNDFNGDLAVKIFKGFYKEEYSTVWVGVDFLRTGGTPLNKYFLGQPRKMAPGIWQEISLNEDKSVTLVLTYKQK